ncbi:MAG: glycosyltransferase family protein [Actinobacteria bacterium]|nr:glycosyltransferase family protein [Actinomycetota bacterium]MBT5182235.1 glycosyltransferase family protein [Actinomycetota bacterium]
MPGSGSTIAIVQARMGSTRLPGKVLADLCGAPLLQRQLERVRRATSLDRVVVATSTDETDLPIAELCESLDVPCFRGDLNDVLARFLGAINEFNPEVVVRITADCPLISPSVIDSIVHSFFESDCDYLSNTLDPTFPDGVDVEVVRVRALRALARLDTDTHEREHVTLGIYRRPEQFVVRNFTGDPDLSNLRWTVDSPEDLEFVRWVYTKLFYTNPKFDLAEILELLGENIDKSRTDSDSRRNSALDGLNTGVMQHRNCEPSPTDI